MTEEKGRLWARALSTLSGGRTVLCRNKGNENVHKSDEQSGAFGTVAVTYGKAGNPPYAIKIQTPSSTTLTCTLGRGRGEREV
jgi:hypothetical protein